MKLNEGTTADTRALPAMLLVIPAHPALYSLLVRFLPLFVVVVVVVVVVLMWNACFLIN